MKRSLQFIPVLSVALLLVLGAAMPRLAALVIDRGLEKEILQRENTTISLSLEEEADFFDTLQLFGGGHSQVKLSEGYHMTAEEAASAAGQMILELAASGGVYQMPEVTPILFTSRDTPVQSGIFWRCVWGDSADDNEILWLDDQSGQMMAFQCKFGRSSLPASDGAFLETVMKAAEFCNLHYPVDTVTLADGTAETVTSAVAIDDKIGEVGGDYIATLSRNRGGREETHTILARRRGEWLYFNI